MYVHYMYVWVYSRDGQPVFNCRLNCNWRKLLGATRILTNPFKAYIDTPKKPPHDRFLKIVPSPYCLLFMK